MTQASSAPTWDKYMAPALRAPTDGEVHRARAIVEAGAVDLGLSAEHRAILIPSGQEQYRNRGAWALSYLARVGAVERPARGQYRITDVGRRLLAQHPSGITEKDLRALSGVENAPHTWKAFPATAAAAETPDIVAGDGRESVEATPQEQVERGIERIHTDVALDLLQRLHAHEPAFFEQVVLDVLMAMGYGGTDGRATRTELSGDGGIDGIIDQDALGLSRIYVQAKRYALDASVGRPEIQGFVGALHGHQASQGVFITTGRFSSGGSTVR